MKALDYDGLDHVVDKIYDLINSGGSADYIVEEGTSGIWTYRKWASGIAECWGKYNWASVNINSAWGSVYVGSPSPATIDYPSGLFIEPPICNRIQDTNGGNYWLSTNFAGGVGTKDHTPAVQPVRGTSATGVSVVVNFDVKGFWKAFTPSVMKQGQSLRTWNFTPASGISMSQNGAVVRNGIAMGTLIINGSFNATANTYKQIGTTTDKPQGDYVLFDCYRGSDALYEGVIRITSGGSVDFNSVRGMSSGTIYLQLVYTLTD